MTRDEPATATASRAITFSRLLNARRELVFRAWTDPAQVGIWWGPRGFTTTTHEMDARPGGHWRFVMHGPDGKDYDNLITFVEVAAPERLVYDHGDDSDPHQFRSVVTFEEQDGRTLLTMTAVFASAEARDKAASEYGAIEGGSQHLECLDQFLASQGVAEQAGRAVEITRVFDAPRDLVWEAWTVPERFVQWWGPHDFTTPMCEIDLRPGGRLRFAMRPKDGPDIWCGGVFQEVEAPSKLVFTDYFTRESGEVALPTECGLSEEWPVQALVTVTFEDLGGKTKLTLRHHASGGRPEEFEGAEQGWDESFDRLAALLAN